MASSILNTMIWAHFMESVHSPHDEEGSLFLGEAQVVAHVHPEGAELGDTVVAYR